MGSSVPAGAFIGKKTIVGATAGAAAAAQAAAPGGSSGGGSSVAAAEVFYYTGTGFCQVVSRHPATYQHTHSLI